jgi:hypothetical protein
MSGKAEFKVRAHLENYIAAPYWPEVEKLINIKKESGVSRARTAETRRKALDSYLKAAGMTREQYEELERLAARPFHLDGQGRIIVPQLHVMSMIVACCDRIIARDRPCAADMARTVISATPWTTGKTQPDGTWERFAVVSSGTGAKLSNQRALRADAYIADADAEGVIAADTSVVRPEILFKALAWAGTYVGIGSARKMGWGRFTITPL